MLPPAFFALAAAGAVRGAALLPRASAFKPHILATASAGPSSPSAVRITGDANGEVVAGEVLRVAYTPPAGAGFREGASLTLAGGFNDWDPEDAENHADQRTQVLLTPDASGGGGLSGAVALPLHARSLTFGVTDGIKWDTNEDAWYRVHVDLIAQPDGDKGIKLLRQLPDGAVVPLDGAPLGAEDGSDAEQDQSDVMSSINPSKVLDPEVERAVQENRARAAEVGKDAGLSNMAISEARMAFERHALPPAHTELPAERLLTVLGADGLGFEMSEAELTESLGRNGVELSAGEPLSIVDFIRVFAALEQDGVGLEIV